ncbi:unnamed protein product [Amoebophrya sp. A120]|nr:unnamed protein product [Amoebophrya sp. A120]|eukprot:GSA120T00005240001.1
MLVSSRSLGQQVSSPLIVMRPRAFRRLVSATQTETRSSSSSSSTRLWRPGVVHLQVRPRRFDAVYSASATPTGPAHNLNRPSHQSCRFLSTDSIRSRLQALETAQLEKFRTENAAAWEALEAQLEHIDPSAVKPPVRKKRSSGVEALASSVNGTPGSAEDVAEQMQEDEEPVDPPQPRQLQLYFLGNFLPFLAFGFLDNTIMLVFGEFFDAYLGAFLGISTMAAAALGNIVGDVSGIWLGGTVEYLAGLHVDDHRLTSRQMKLHEVQRMKTVAMATGIFTGCLLGMFPLLFTKSREERERAAEDGA